MQRRFAFLLAAVVFAAAFQQAPPITHIPRPRQPEAPREQLTPPSPINPNDAARRLRFQIGPWDARCRPGNEATLNIQDLTTIDERFTRSVQAVWKLELMFVRAPQGYNVRALEPGECALADSPLPGTQRYVRLVRLLEARGTPHATNPRLALLELETPSARGDLSVRSADATFDAIAWRAAIGPRGSVWPPFSVPRPSGPYPAFGVRLTQCDERCARGRNSTAGVFYVAELLPEPSPRR